jgi:hypothetical protein
MKTALTRAARPLLVGIALWNAAPAFAGGDPSEAGVLIAQVIAARQTTGFRVRARLVCTTSGAERRDVTQLLIKGRRDGETSKVLYQILWPKRSIGETLVIERTAGRKARCWLFTPPDQVTLVTPERLGRPFFGSDLTIEDLAEEFWHWPAQKIVGEETLVEHRCQVLDSRPATGTVTSYALVRSWIAPDIALPLRIDKFAPDGRLVKRLTAENLTRLKNNVWTAATVLVESGDGRTRTALEGKHADRDIEIPDGDFTVEGIQAALRPKP